MKKIPFAINIILKRILYCFLFLLFLGLAWAACIKIYGNEEPDAGIDAFYEHNEVKVPDTKIVSVANSGLHALFINII